MDALANVLAPNNQMRHCVPQMNHLVVAATDELILSGMDRQRQYIFGVTLKNSV